MEAFQGGVFVVSIDGSMGRAEVLVELYEVRGERTFTNTTFAVED
jgi:hypothetical protein